MPEKEDRWLFFLIYLLLGTLIAGSILMVYFGESRRSQGLISLEKQMDLESQEKLVNLRFESVISDINFLTNLDDLRIAMESGDYSAVEREFISFSNAKKAYDQLRFIDRKGMEIVRVNSRNGAVRPVPGEELQDKSDRYYVRDAMNLVMGDVYISPLDLNIEKGVIEDPPVPMIRFAAPVYLNREFEGLIVINYRAALLLEELESSGARNKGDFYLLNREGFYLASPENNQEWGFMFSERKTHRFQLNDPEHWEQIRDNDSYQYESSSMVISSRIIRPVTGLNVQSDDYYWIAVSVVPEEQIDESIHFLMFRLFFLGVFLFLFSAIPAWTISKTVIRFRRTRRELYKSANYDELTALPNRHMFHDRLDQAYIQALRYSLTGALLFIDLDGFKAVNDNYGHETGDELLKQVGKRLSSSIRGTDTAARYGGDEFIVLLPVEQDLDGVKLLAEKLIGIISRPYRLTGVEITVGASIGIRFFPSENDKSVESVDILIKDADTAMYEAKASGKGRISIWKENPA